MDMPVYSNHIVRTTGTIIQASHNKFPVKSFDKHIVISPDHGKIIQRGKVLDRMFRCDTCFKIPGNNRFHIRDKLANLRSVIDTIDILKNTIILMFTIIPVKVLPDNQMQIGSLFIFGISY